MMGTKQFLLLLLCALLGLAGAASNQDLSGTADGETHKELLVRLHNEYRCRHTTELQEVDHDGDSTTAMIHLPKVALVHWSDALQEAAECWALTMAESGSFAHSYGECGTDGMGENIAYYGGSSTGEIKDRIEGAMSSFYSEYADLKAGDSDGGSLGGSVGHFTQIVWQGTTTIGCGTAVQSGDSYDKWYLSCNYKSAGNVAGSYANNVECANTDSTACQPWDTYCAANPTDSQCEDFDYTTSSCTIAIAYEDTAEAPEFHGTDDSSVVSGTSAASPHVTRPGYHSDVTSLHATKVCWTTQTSDAGTAPSDPTCEQSTDCESSNHHEFTFDYTSSEEDQIMAIKMIGCSGGGNSAVSTEYFQLSDSLPPQPITFDPVSGSTIVANSHIHAYSQAETGSTTYQSSSRICWTVNTGDAITDPTCDQTDCETDHPDELDLVVADSETVAVVACVKKLDGTWLKEPSSGSTQASYTVSTSTGDYTDCDSTLTGSFASFVESYCNAGCYTGYHKYLLINSACNSVGYDYQASEDDALDNNPGKLVADTDGDRCASGFGVSGASVCSSSSGSAAKEGGSTAGTSSAAWTTSTTVVLVVALVAMVAVGVAAFMLGKRSSVSAKAARQQPLTDLAEELDA